MGSPECPFCRRNHVRAVAQGFTCADCEFSWSPPAGEREPAERKVFLSYGRADAAEVADRLEADLARANFKTWRDTHEIRAGRAWEEKIKEGLVSSDAMVAVLSPHSVRTVGAPGPKVDSDSVCLDEIAFARYSVPRIPIVPAMAKDCEPPLSVFRLHFVDLRRWQEDDAYAKALAELLEGLEAAILGTERFREDVAQLRPWDFDSILAKKLEDFVGREWLVAEINEWAKNPTEPALAIIGDPGCGKSAIAAHLVHRNPDGRILAYHFCQDDFVDTLDPREFVRSVAAMLAGRIPAYADELAGPSVREALQRDDPVRAFEHGILGPLARIPAPADGVRILLVDALDEALVPGRSGKMGIVELLTTRLERFPPWLKLVATSRREQPVLDRLRGQGLRELSAQDPRNLEDLSKYIAIRLEEPGLAARLRDGRTTREAVTAALLKGAAGNFLYVKEALVGIERGLHDIDDLDALPPGLHGLYERFFERSFPDAAAYAPVAPILDVVVAAESPLTARQLARAVGLPGEEDLEDDLEKLSAYLPPRTGHDGLVRYTVFHKSLADWLATAPRPYRASPEAGHRRLAASLWSEYERGPSSLSAYALAHLPRHLAAGARASAQPDRRDHTHRLVTLTADERFQEVHERRLDDLVALHRHLQLAVEVAAENDSPDSAELATDSALALVGMRRKRLRPERLFELAREGDVERVQERLDLFRVDEDWRQAVLLTAALLAPKESVGVARSMVERVRDNLVDRHPLPLLVERVFAWLDDRPFAPDPLPPPPPQDEAYAIVARLGGMDLEQMPTLMYEGMGEGMAERMHPGQLAELVAAHEEAPSQSEFEAPQLVSFALACPDPGEDIFRNYVRIHASNAYVTYRNRALWGILRSVVRHPDAEWVARSLQQLSGAALAGGNPEFEECLGNARWAVAAKNEPADFVEECETTVQFAEQLNPGRGEGDSWGAHKRRLAVKAECLVLRFGDGPEAERLLDLARRLRHGFAGFGGPAFLTVAEAVHIAGVAGRDDALAAAVGAAVNVQDPSFCARSVSRCRTIRDQWWPRMPLDLPLLIERFVREPGAADFAPVHEIGCDYEGRSDAPGSIPLPDWVTEARSLEDLSWTYQRAREDLEALNPGIDDPMAALEAGAEVRVPDPEFAPILAAWLSAQVITDPVLAPGEKVALIQKLLPVAVANPTALDTILGRLCLAAAE